MIRKFPPRDHIVTALFQRVPKTRRIANPAKRRHPPAPKCFYRFLRSIRRNQFLRRMPTLRPNNLRRNSLHFRPYPSALSLIHHVRPSQHRRIGSHQAFQRLPQRPPRKHMTKPKRLQRIDQYDIQIPRQPTMLKSIVQQNHLRAPNS